MQSAASFNIESALSEAHGQMYGGDGKSKYNLRGHDSAGQQVSNSGSSAESDGSEPVRMLRLKVEQQECWEMKGTVDSSEMTRDFNGAGMQVSVTGSKWSATIDQRDVNFEKRVQAIVAEPVPHPLTGDYVDSFHQRWQALRKGKLDNYHLCILKDLDWKANTIYLAALSELLKDFPKVRSMNNACTAVHVVMAASLQRILTLARRLQLMGVDCPLVSAWPEVVSKEMHELVKNTLSRPHTDAEVECLGRFVFRAFMGTVDIGDQTTPLYDEFLMLAARMEGHTNQFK
jgi:hypothetical protein